MKNFTKFIFGLLAFALAWPVMALDADGYNTARLDAYTVPGHIETDRSIALRIRNKTGIATGATIDVIAAGDIAFTTNGTAADTTLGLPTTDGTIDVSDAAANTLGEVCDNINASANWQCIIVDGLPSDPSSTCFLDIAETSTSTGLTSTYSAFSPAMHGLFDDEGIEILFDISASLNASVCIGPQRLSDDIFGTDGNNFSTRIANPVTGRLWNCEVFSFSGIFTYSGGAGRIQVWAVKGNGASAIQELVWDTLGGASTVAATQSFTTSTPFGIRARTGFHLIVKISGMTGTTVSDMQVLGQCWQ